VQNGSHPILTDDARDFLIALHTTFNDRRLQLLSRRHEVAAQINRSGTLDFLPQTANIRNDTWTVAPAPADLNDRRVEITGPAEPKMMINALNSGAKVFMADLEDSLAPTWQNVLDGQSALREAVRRTLNFSSPDHKQYKLNETTATLVVRPRGWHMFEKNFLIKGEPMSGSLFDFGLYMFHNAHELLNRKSGPYFYLPKLESHLEARLWNDVFVFAQNALGVPRGSIRATVLIETLPAAFEMDEILFELREHAAGLNAGRWDYLFSMIKKFAARADLTFPDRAQLTMTVPFMRAYTELLVETCHRRRAHAIGGMAAFIPSRKDPAVNEVALVRVREDKQRESHDGFDGTWVAHPDLVPIARAEFDAVLAGVPNQKSVRKTNLQIRAADLLPSPVAGGRVTLAGVRNNISVAIQYLESWLQGRGAVAIFNLMEDAATAEISRAELWQWLRQGLTPEGGVKLDANSFASLLSQEVEQLGAITPQRRQAAELLQKLVTTPEFTEFLTTPAYEQLN
jgi:malate synthase